MIPRDGPTGNPSFPNFKTIGITRHPESQSLRNLSETSTGDGFDTECELFIQCGHKGFFFLIVDSHYELDGFTAVTHWESSPSGSAAITETASPPHRRD